MDFTAVILAAGQGRRAGGFKPLFPLGSGTVIDRVVTVASHHCNEIRVVGGCNFEQLEQHFDTVLPVVSRDRVILINNTSWESGMFSSVQAGLGGTVGPVFIHPSDIPGPDAGVYRDLAGAFAVEDDDYRDGAAFRPVWNGRAGHPVLMGPAVVRAVLDAPDDGTLREVLSKHNKTDVPATNDLVLCDFDTNVQYEVLKERLSAENNKE